MVRITKQTDAVVIAQFDKATGEIYISKKGLTEVIARIVAQVQGINLEGFDEIAEKFSEALEDE